MFPTFRLPAHPPSVRVPAPALLAAMSRGAAGPADAAELLPAVTLSFSIDLVTTPTQIYKYDAEYLDDRVFRASRGFKRWRGTSGEMGRQSTHSYNGYNHTDRRLARRPVAPHSAYACKGYVYVCEACLERETGVRRT